MEGATFLSKLSALHQGFGNDGVYILQCIARTCREMLLDRGCEEIHVSPDLVQSVLDGEPIVKGNKTWVYLHFEEKVGVKLVRVLLEESERNGVHVVSVSIDGPTPFTKKECEGKSIQFLTTKYMCNNVTKHKLVPKHVSLPSYPEEEKAHLPKMFDTDAIAQYYNWPVGTVVRIERMFGGHEPIPYFRIVCAASN